MLISAAQTGEDHKFPTRSEDLLMGLKLKIFRFDPQKDEKPYYQTFMVDAEPTDRLLDCLNRIRWEQDPTLSFRMSCAHGICGSDGMRINGICGLPCQKLVKDFKDEVLLEPELRADPGFESEFSVVANQAQILETWVREKILEARYHQPIKPR
jgi:hypothetical protein